MMSQVSPSGRENRVSSHPRLRIASVLLVAALAACQTPSPPLEVVEDVDLDRYAGLWYEISSYPQRFQRGCVATKATYTLVGEGRIRVENECRDGAIDGELRRIEGTAWAANPNLREGKLKVQFFWPFSADYWIIELDPDYQFAVVGHPSRKFLWILSRTPTLEPTIYQELLERIRSHGYEAEGLNITLQAPLQ
jgi:apolipoprotein D and lipocalin family protein